MDPNDKRLQNLRPFKPGEVHNPLGAGAQSKEFKALQILTKKQLAKIGTVLFNGTADDLEAIHNDPTTPFAIKIIIVSMQKAYKNADFYMLDLILNRIVGKPKEEVSVSVHTEHIEHLTKEQIREKTIIKLERISSREYGRVEQKSD